MARGRSTRDNERTREGTKHRDASPADARLALLVATTGGVALHALPSRGKVVLGRAVSCDVAIDDDSISRRHAALHLDAGRVTLEDLESMNGTYVNGTRLDPGRRHDVAVGSGIELGDVTVVLQRATRALVGAARAPQHAPPPDADVVIQDAAMQRLYQMLDVIAPSLLAVLVLGETGTGKEVFAEALHRRSPRAARPFLKLNCAALPESVLEGELFGYERGAFTGALQAKPGLFESADGGTVFLDEVGELTLATQAKLLRVLESGEVMRLGSLRPKVVDVRFVSATNRDLEQRIQEGTFRSDLFFRINGVSLTLPPLRDRRDDIVPLAEMFAARACGRAGRPASSFDPAATAALEAHGWPGNIRELRNVVERTVLLCRGSTVGVADLALSGSNTRPPVPPPALEQETAVPRPSAAPSSASLRSEMDAIEKAKILDALERCAGNQSRAAKLLGIGRRTLIDKLDAYGLPRPRKAPASEDD